MCVCSYIVFGVHFEDRRADIIPHLYNIITTIVIVGAMVHTIFAIAVFHTLLCPICACVCSGEIDYREWKNKTLNETTTRPGPYFLFPRRVSSRTGR